MPTWTIYSMGDAAFLEQIMIAVAMVTGTGDFLRAASIGLLMALVILSFQSIMKGAQQLNYQQAFGGWLIFAIMFWPSTTVAIEDGVTGDVRVVAHVPFGVGAAGGMISSIGYGLTSLFEQGYSYIAPALTESRFADSLTILNGLRSAGNNPRVMTALNNAAGGDLRQSWDNYIRECALVKVDLGIESPDEILSKPMPDALRFDSDLFGTRHFLTNKNGADATCSVAFDLLRSTTQSAMYDSNFTRTLGQALGKESADEPSPIGSMHYIADSMDTLRLSMSNAYSFVQASILEPLYSAAVTGKYQDMQDFSSAVMISQAIQQRNIQWAAEQSMFMSVIRPMQTFFEGFVYALTPLIGVLIITGSFGMTLAFKYLQTLLWIQFWLPVLSIVNLYIHVASTRALSAFNNPEMTSIYTLSGVFDTLQQWIAVGGMLAAATPVISLFLVTGSTYAMTSIAGKISGSDHVNEKLMSPDVAQPGAVMAMQPKFAANTVQGTTLNGAEGLISNLSFGSMLSGNVSSAEQNTQQAQEQFSRQLSRTVDSAAQSGRQGQLMEQFGSVTGSMSGKQASAVQKVAGEIAKQHGLTTEQAQAVQGAVGLVAAGGVQGTAGGDFSVPIKQGQNGERTNKKGGAGASLKADASASASSSTTDSLRLSTGDILRRLENAGFDKTDSASFSNQLAYAVQSSGSDTWSHLVGDKAAKSLTNSASELVTSGKTYSEMAALAQQFGTSGNARLDAVAGLLANPEGLASSPQASSALNELNDYFRTGAAGPAVQENALAKARFFENHLGKDARTSQVMGRLAAMMNLNNYGDTGQAMDGIKTAAGILNKAMGNDIAMPERNPVDFQGMSGPSFAPGSIRSQAEGATAVAGSLPIGDHFDFAAEAYGSAKDRFDTKMAMPETQDNISSLVDDYQLNSNNVERVAHADRRSQTDDAMRRNEDNLMAANLGSFGRGDMSEAAKFFGQNSNWFKSIMARGESAYGALGTAISEMNPSEAQAYFTNNMEQFRSQEVTNAMNDYGLTREQATLLAYTQTGAGSERIEQARQQLVDSYPANYSETANKIADHIQYAAMAGDKAGSNLYHVQENNTLRSYRGDENGSPNSSVAGDSNGSNPIMNPQLIYPPGYNPDGNSPTSAPQPSFLSPSAPQPQSRWGNDESQPTRNERSTPKPAMPDAANSGRR